MKLFNNIKKCFFTPINFLLYFAIFMYLIGYWTGNADLSGVKVFGTACIVGNIISGILMTFTDSNNSKKFDSFYIYGNSEKGRKR